VAWFTARRSYRSATIRRTHERKAAEICAQIRRENKQLEETRQELHRAIEQLPDEHRDALILHHIEGYSVEETAALGLPGKMAAVVTLFLGVSAAGTTAIFDLPGVAGSVSSQTTSPDPPKSNESHLQPSPGVSVVPEPGLLPGLALGGMLLLRRDRKR